MSFINDCSNQTLLKLQSYLTKRGIIIQDIEEYKGLYNKEFGDLKINGFTINDKPIQLNIDFKKQEKDRPFIPIELIYVKYNGSYDGWLWNANEDLIVYEFRDGSTFIFEHKDLIRLAKYFNTEEVWNTCFVYSKNPEEYKDERTFINSKLAEYDLSPLPLVGNISSSDIHINGAYNYTYNGKVHSGFCLNIPLEYARQFQIASRIIVN